LSVIRNGNVGLVFSNTELGSRVFSMAVLSSISQGCVSQQDGL
jgi:hypothetical protein